MSSRERGRKQAREVFRDFEIYPVSEFFRISSGFSRFSVFLDPGLNDLSGLFPFFGISRFSDFSRFSGFRDLARFRQVFPVFRDFWILLFLIFRDVL